MKLRSLIQQYVLFKRSLGFVFRTNENTLLWFNRTVGAEIELEDITDVQITAFLNGSGPLTRTWHVKYNALMGLYRYAIRKGYATEIPLPSVVPKQPETIAPYIYSSAEVKKILDATSTYQKNRSSIEPITVRTIILVLYGAGLRPREAVSLAVGDVDLIDRLLIVRNSKFGKSRIVPIGKKLIEELRHYSNYRNKIGMNLDENEPFFVLRTGKSVILDSFEGIFQCLREHAGICRNDGAKYQPRLHDFRHSFAVHQLTAWYRQGKDVQKLLHPLSVYLGHENLVGSQVYLSMTPQLLEEANFRFQEYALGEDADETN